MNSLNTEPHRGEGLVQQGGSLLDERLRRPLQEDPMASHPS